MATMTFKTEKITLLAGEAIGFIIKVLLLLNLVITLAACQESIKSPAAMVRISSDGRYVISTHYGRYLILWDVQKRQKTIINRKACLYSAYFIPDSHYFLWQDAKTHTVYVQAVSGEIVKTLHPGFEVYGHVMTTDLQHYAASTNNWGLYRLDNGIFQCFKETFYSTPGSVRLLQLTLKKNLLLSSGNDATPFYPFKIGVKRSDVRPSLPRRMDYSYMDGLVIWDMTTGKPLRKFIGLTGQGTADLSPDTTLLAGGDEQVNLYVWETQYGKCFCSMDTPTVRQDYCYGSAACLKEHEKYLKTVKVVPDDFYENSWTSALTIAVKFIDEQGHLFRLIKNVNYATLYQASSPKVLAYLDLGHNPKPYTASIFDGANVIDTAPKAQILVMKQSMVDHGLRYGTGIIVYHFNDKTQTLERLWAPDGPGRHRRIINPDNPGEV